MIEEATDDDADKKESLYPPIEMVIMRLKEVID
jgi:hypothetical protein